MAPTKLTSIRAINNRIQLLNQNFTPHPKQRDIISGVLKAGFKRVLLLCGRSFGKTTVVDYLALRTACHPNKSIYIIGPDRTQQRRIMWNDPSTNLQHFIPPEFETQSLETTTTIKFPWDSFITIDGSENYAAYRGVPYDLMIIDEGAQIDWRFYDASYPNLSKKNGTLIIISSRADLPTNQFELKYQEALLDPDWYVMEATSWENPYIVEWLEKEKKKYFARGDIAEWMLEYENKRISGGKRSVFPMFSREKHVRPHDWIMGQLERDKQQIEYFDGFDPGSHSVFAAGCIAYNRMTSQVFILDEIYEKDRTKTSSRKIWARMEEKEKELYPTYPRLLRVYDEAAAWFARELADLGIALAPTSKESRDKEDDISIMKDFMLGEGNFYISDRCEHGINEFENYKTDENNKPLDTADHFIDLTRYVFRIGNFSLENLAPLEEEGERSYHRPDRDMNLTPRTDNAVEYEEDDSWEDMWLQ